MDKYEYNLKLEEIDKLVDQGDYEEAANLADTIEWRRVRNVRTLSLMSEIYEAAGKLEKSKDMLVRAYRKSPVGRNVLYRLVEVTTALGEYEEALEYYAEYVQAAPHDNNRFILKYKIYRGRGSSTEELIAILEEYLGLEYTERWAYELALLYQEAGQIQKCMATCDDLVLWFHSGKYVKKALDLKKRYAVLTPKQKQIYEVCLQEEAQSDYFEDPEEDATALRKSEDADDEVLAENIIAETEKEIAGEITARKVEREKGAREQAASSRMSSADKEGSDSDNRAEEKDGSDIEARSEGKEQAGRSAQKAAEPGLFAKVFRKGSAKSVRKDSERISEAAGVTQGRQSGEESSGESVEEEREREMASVAYDEPELVSAAYDEPVLPDSTEYDDLQVEMAKSVRKVISGVARKPELNEDDVPAAVEERLRGIQEVSRRREPEPVAGKLSIDDILLAMGEKGKQAAAAARAQRETAAAQEGADDRAAAQKSADSAAPEDGSQEKEPESAGSAVTPEDRGQEKEPESAGSAIAPDDGSQGMEPDDRPTGAADVAGITNIESKAVFAGEENTGSKVSTRPVNGALSELAETAEDTVYPTKTQDVRADRTNAPRAKSVAAAAASELTQEQLEALRYSSNPEKFLKRRNALPTYEAESDSVETENSSESSGEENAEMRASVERILAAKNSGEKVSRTDTTSEDNSGATRRFSTKEELLEAARQEIMTSKTIRIPAEEVAKAYSRQSEVLPGSTQGLSERTGKGSPASRDEARTMTQNERTPRTDMPNPEADRNVPDPAAPETNGPGPDAARMSDKEASVAPIPETSNVNGQDMDISEEEEYFDDPLTLAPYHRGMFAGFTEIDGLEYQIATAILQAKDKGNDRTSRNGNILIFGAHGSGKTTIATNIAKAIAQEKGRQTAKMARIYAVDLNRRDIAATVAKIAGGILIVEEAGDLADNTVEQLTTAMEFRTDGLIVILEDEQRYL
ncbi:MAG: ATP-binding protein, partial [Lachnospiraceae bacterium]|nr:ATP-binding protein [Lachnospiraceae bacterium]